MHVASDSLASSEAENDGGDLLELFGSMLVTLLTLYQSITGGMDWGDVAAPLIEIHPVMGFFFATYIAFAVLCVLNVVTGVFVENANKIVQNDIHNQLLVQATQRREWMRDVQKVFDLADLDRNGLDLDEFQTYVRDE